MRIDLVAIVLLLLRLCNATSGWIVSATVRQKYIDGKNGSCGRMAEDDTLCRQWENPKENATSFQEDGNCKYRQKVMTTTCYGERNSLGNVTNTFFYLKFLIIVDYKKLVLTMTLSMML